jgi:hypothetical protein
MFNPFKRKLLKMEDLDLKCEHEWRLVAKTYAPPRKDVQAESLEKDTQEKLFFGVTTVMWECAKGGMIRKEEVLWTDENQLLDIFDKVEKFGMQYVKEGDHIFVVAKWVPPATQVATPTR